MKEYGRYTYSPGFPQPWIDRQIIRVVVKEIKEIDKNIERTFFLPYISLRQLIVDLARSITLS